MSNDYVKLDHDEIVELREKASEFVSRYLRNVNPNNPNMRLAPFLECRVGRTDISCPIQGVNSLNLTFEDQARMQEEFPGASIYTERMPDGSEISYKLNIPILRKRSVQRRSGKTTGTKPTLEWALLLAVVEAGLCGIFYYRWTAGLVF